MTATNIAHLRKSDDPLDRARYWLAELGWRDSEVFHMMQHLEREVKQEKQARDELRQAARAVLDAYAAGADLNTLNGVIQTELAPLVEHEEAA